MGCEASEPRKIKRPMAETVENLIMFCVEWIVLGLPAFANQASRKTRASPEATARQQAFVIGDTRSTILNPSLARFP
jgi:hypothetical protein